MQQEVYFEIDNADLDRVELSKQLIKAIKHTVNTGDKTLIIVKTTNRYDREVLAAFIKNLFSTGIAFNMNAKERQNVTANPHA